MKIACGLVTPDSGTATVAGALAGSRAARARVGYLAELFRFPPALTGDELLAAHQRLAGSAGGATERERLLALAGVEEVAGRRIGTLSKGNQQRLGLAQALIGSPALLLLDEPTSALDPIGRRTVRKVLDRLRADGVGVLVNSHLLTEIEDVCDRVVLMRDGTVVGGGRVAELAPPGSGRTLEDVYVETMEAA